MLKRTITTVIFIGGFISFVYCQLSITIQPDPSAYAVCPNSPMNYAIRPSADASCYTLEVVNGTPAYPYITTSGEFGTTWMDNGLPGKIIARKKANCSNSSLLDSVVWNIPTKSLALAKAPSGIIGATSIELGRLDELQYQVATAYFPMRGTAEIDSTPVPKYVWTYPDAWYRSSYKDKQEITLGTDYFYGGTITARASSGCPAPTLPSEAAELYVIRTTPIPYIESYDVTYCGYPQPIFLNTRFETYNGLSGEDYNVEWTFPPNWQRLDPGQFNGIAKILPDGYSGGTIKALFTFNKYDLSPITVEKHITLSKRVPSLSFYSNATYSNFNKAVVHCDTAQANFSAHYLFDTTATTFPITWEVTPYDSSYLEHIIPHSGVGKMAQFINDSSLTKCRIVFSITSPDTCYLSGQTGQDFWIGKIEPLTVLVDGEPWKPSSYSLCPGYHQISIKKVIGYPTNTIQWRKSPHITAWDSTYVYHFFVEPSGVPCGTIEVSIEDICGNRYVVTTPFCLDISTCENAASAAINIAPVPATNGIITVQIDPNSTSFDLLRIQNIEIFNALGQKVQEETVLGSTLIVDIADWPTGMYWLRADMGISSAVKSFLVR
jgi:hypothetical protein